MFIMVSLDRVRECVLIYCIVIPVISGQEIMNCASESDIIFMVDSSVSIRESNPLDNTYDNWQIIKDFIVNITMRLPVANTTRVGVLTYSGSVDTQDIIRLGDYTSRDDLKSKINNLHFLGKGTNTSGAIWYINSPNSGMFQSDQDRPLVQNYGILITDGLSNRDPEKTRPYAREARLNFNTKFFTVGITKYANVDELQEIASDPVVYYSFLSKNFRNLNVLLDSMLTRLCRETPPPRAPCMDSRADVTFLLDSSGSIGQENWSVLKQFVLEVIDSLDLADNKTRVAVIRYSTKAEVVFSLDKYFGPTATDGISAMRKVIMNLVYLDTRTNISGALKLMRRDVFQEHLGDRPGIQNIGILISDGQATDDVNDTSVQARLVKEDGVRMFALGLTTEIEEQELTTIASKPLTIHYLNATRITDAPTLMSRLVWGLCSTNCEGDTADVPECWRNTTTLGCQGNVKPVWKSYPERLLLGHNYDRLENIMSAVDCQKLCFRDPQCRSIDYVSDFKQCAVSYVTKAEAIASFVYEPTAHYYELSCDGGDGGDGGGSNDPVKPTNAGNVFVVHYYVVLFTVVIPWLNWYRHRLRT